MGARNARKISFLGDFPPRQCGIATFTRDLHQAVTRQRPEWSTPVLSVTDPGFHYDYPDVVRFELPERSFSGYQRAADFINLSHTDLLCIQHEFGIYGGPAGSHLLNLIRRLRLPVVTTLHTVLEDPTSEQRRVMEELLQQSDALVVMSERGQRILQATYQLAPEKIHLIPHGIPDQPFVDPNFYKDQYGVAGRPMMLTFGLLSPGKGIEYGIEALPAILAHHPDLVYVILGATHPNLMRAEGETYRLSLERLAQSLGVESNVIFVNRYVDDQQLMEYIGAADIYLTPYLNPAQITSGTLAYCYGAGKAVVSTPYWHAEELLAQGRGLLVPFRDGAAIASAVNGLLSEPGRLLAMRKQAWLAGRDMVWAAVGERYAQLFEGLLAAGEGRARTLRPAATLAVEGAELPPWRFQHLEAMADSTGVFQHAVHSVPDFNHGYCTDDNARALLLTAQLEHLGEPLNGLRSLQSAAAAFLHYAFVPESGRFRNFMGFDRRWLENVGSEDSHGRALWGLGAIVGRTAQTNLRNWAARLFERALPALEGFTSPRAWAFSVLGLHEYLRVLHGDLLAARWRLDLSERLLSAFAAQASDDWPWLEPIVSYDNARLPQALILSGRWLGRSDMLETGLRALTWLQRSQTAPGGHFRPIGSEGFWLRGGQPASHDQQPLEASASVAACLEALHATGDDHWRLEANRCFEWFLGRNDLNRPLYDGSNGGCFDGLQPTGVNRNQGAESTLSFLIALADMKLLTSEDVTPHP
ncbi:MAG: glycosyltransferase family 4 protein [Cyanobacteriota bacterium]|nr:glycosyltransferase family 4 protein [Cyanobacteriota bacterium]